MTLTAKITTGCIIALGIYDLAAVTWGGDESTISRFMQNAGFDHPFIVFSIGYICGHIWGFFPPKCRNCGVTFGKENQDRQLESTNQ